MSAYSLAKEQIAAAMAEASAQELDRETVLRALVTTCVEQYRDAFGAAAVKDMLQFQVDNCQGDEDYMFMRP